MRLDRFLSETGVGTRSTVAQYIRKCRVAVNGEIIKNPAYKLDETSDKVTFDGRLLEYEEFLYYMLNKPQGFVTATKDNACETVMDLFPEEKRTGLFPVGRLDKDTEGLLIITNDGELAHRLLSPSRHVDKVYYVRLDGPVCNDDIRRFEEGMELGDFTTLPARLEAAGDADDIDGTASQAYVTIREGKFHQIKRMFEAVGKQVVYLKRVAMGGVELDKNLEPGEYRRLTDEELHLLKSK